MLAMSTMMDEPGAVQGAARPRPGARPERRGHAQVEGQRHPVRRRRRRRLRAVLRTQTESKPEDQAARELPAGWLSLAEDTVRIEKREFLALKAKYPPMGADLMRWMYCRQNPAANINFGPGPAEELRSKFILKLWNTYAFFCNYARLDGFDPSAPQVPVKERPDIDRWILSDLQLLDPDRPARGVRSRTT